MLSLSTPAWSQDWQPAFGGLTKTSSPTFLPHNEVASPRSAIPFSWASGGIQLSSAVALLHWQREVRVYYCRSQPSLNCVQTVSDQMDEQRGKLGFYASGLTLFQVISALEKAHQVAVAETTMATWLCQSIGRARVPKAISKLREKEKTEEAARIRKLSSQSNMTASPTAPKVALVLLGHNSVGILDIDGKIEGNRQIAPVEVADGDVEGIVGMVSCG